MTGQSTSSEHASLLERLPKYAGAAAVAMLCMSVAHDASYLFGVGLTFGDVPTSMQDHVRSALVWAPQSFAGILIGGMAVVVSRRSPRAARGVEIGANVLMGALALAGLAIWAMQLSWLLAYLLVLVGWLFATHAALRDDEFRVGLFGPNPRFLPIFLFLLLPLITIANGGIAYQWADWMVSHPSPKWTLTLKDGTQRSATDIRWLGSAAVVISDVGVVSVYPKELLQETRKGAPAKAAASAPPRSP